MNTEKLIGMSRRQFVTKSATVLGASRFLSKMKVPLAQAHAQEASTATSAPSRVIIDTDPGVDDALALLFAMRSPELKIEGITPVAGNVPLELTLPNALRMVEIAGRTDIPVAAGAKTPLVRRLVSATYAHGENGLGGAIFPVPKTKPISQPASDFIREVVSKSPGQIILITIGPLTNVAAALASDAELASKVKALVMMGGSLSGGNITPAAEFNIYVDPEAARIVFQSGIPITMVGLDVTRKTALTAEHIRRLEAGQNSSSQAAAEIARKVVQHYREQGMAFDPNMHDSLAVAAFLRPSLLKWDDYYVDVETTGELTAGETLGYHPQMGTKQATGPYNREPITMPIRGSAPTMAGTKTSSMLRDKFIPNTRVAIDVDSVKFFDFMIGRLAGS